MKKDIKELIEKNVLSFATSSKDGKPNVIAVGDLRIVESKIVIADNYMNKTLKNLKENNKVALVVWENEKGYQIKGTAKYFTEGKWKKIIDGIKEHKAYPRKGAVVVTVEEIFPLAG